MPHSTQDGLLVALAGRQNAGKSTLFNALTGSTQHIANYPGVTVDKKSGAYRFGGRSVEVVDLPGAYSLTAFSLEERVARRFLIEEPPDIVVNVLDASNLKRGLYLTFQLLELGRPVVVALNMIDVAQGRGLSIDLGALSLRLGAPVAAVVGRRGEGIDALRAIIDARACVAETGRAAPAATLNYGPLEAAITALHAQLSGAPETTLGAPARWLAVKLLEDDPEVARLLAERLDNPHTLLDQAHRARADFEAARGLSAADHIGACREHLAGEIVATCVRDESRGAVPLSERIDRFLLHRWLAPLFLTAVVWGIYQLSIVQGHALTELTWPVLAQLRDLAADRLPEAGFLHDPHLRSLGLWMADSGLTLLNYTPIFLILFALIAILEDSGYMARIAFILDRALHRFGLHGQSTLPFILAGVFAGGCAVPGVMATKGIPDERARLATILTAPFMNCLAKIPFYALMVAIWFPDDKGLMLFYLSTITVFAALLAAKLLSVSALRGCETAPFVMELPHYHLPTPSGVARRAFSRTWLYIRKVGSVVIALAVAIYALLQFPGPPPELQAQFHARAEAAIARFYDALGDDPARAAVADQAALTRLANLYAERRAAREKAGEDAPAAPAPAAFAPFLATGASPSTVADSMAALDAERRAIRAEMREARLAHSLLGGLGRALEPVTRLADFDWRMNVALLTSFAARENSVATLGVLYGQAHGENRSLEARMGEAQRASGATAPSAAAVLLFFALYPPCLATMLAVKVETGSWRWTAFAIAFPTALGFAVASLVFTGGGALGLSGLQAMSAVWFGALGLLLAVAAPKRRLIQSDLSRRLGLARGAP